MTMTVCIETYVSGKTGSSEASPRRNVTISEEVSMRVREWLYVHSIIDL